MIVLLSDNAGGVRPFRVRTRHLILARLCASRLDRRLAQGEPAESDVLIALRAARLERERERRDLATGLQRAIQGTDAPRCFPGQVRICQASVRAAQAEIRELVVCLTAAGPVSPRGVAELRMLLTDGTGPFYWETGRDDQHRSLRAELRRVLTNLDPLTPTWG
jgi:hypothetical protein